MKQQQTRRLTSLMRCDKVDRHSIKVVFDVGSRDALQAIELSEEFSNAEVWAFECNPDTLPLLHSNISAHPRVHCVEAAVSDETGTVQFFKIDTTRTQTSHADGNPGASSLFVANGEYPFEKYAQEPVSVQAITLDAFCEKMGIGQVDVIWMDLQGAELKALQGFERHLRKTRYIQVELTHFEIYRGQPLFSDVDRFLLERGFVRLTEANPNSYFEDVIYRNEAFFRVDPRRVVLEQPWGGLGDNLQFSTLPELYARKGVSVYLSVGNKVRSPEILSTVWSENPYVKGLLDEAPTIGAILGDAYDALPKDLPFIQRIEKAHGFEPENRFPKIYQIPQVRPEVSGKVLLDLTSVSFSGGTEKLQRYLQSTLAWYKIPLEKLLQVRFANYNPAMGLYIEGLENITVDSLEDYCAALFSASGLITVHSGAKSLAVAIRQLPGASLRTIHSYATPIQFNYRNFIYDQVHYYVE
jgi:FkbM family methyltransferase